MVAKVQMFWVFPKLSEINSWDKLTVALTKSRKESGLQDSQDFTLWV